MAMSWPRLPPDRPIAEEVAGQDGTGLSPEEIAAS
jgi:hypothetical protein